MNPTPRQAAFDIYWRFAAERQSVFEARAAGESGPWTNDPILQDFKFCNVYRAADRVSQYLIREICYGRADTSPADLAFQIMSFRTFSKPATWDAIRAALGRDPKIMDLESGTLEQVLDHVRAANGGLYTGAFILCATDSYGRRIKHLNHVELFKDMFVVNDLAADIRRAGSLQEVYSLLHTYPLMGDFMSYQVAIDLNYSELTNFSENDFTRPGPGAVRGIKKVFENTEGMTQEEVIMWMVENQQANFDRLDLDFHGLWGRPLHAIDVQNLFCETDKYLRVAMPELSSARSRIKSKFSPTPDPIEYFFPPKWNTHGPATQPSSEQVLVGAAGGLS